MPQVVQARCPQCKNILRIPSDWLTQSMRCKFCRQTFQAKTRAFAGSAVMAGAPSSPAAPAIASRPFSSDPFGFPDEASPPPVAARRKKGRGGLFLLMTFFFLFTLGAAGAGVVVLKVVNPAGWGDFLTSAKTDDKQDTKVVSHKVPNKADGDDSKEKISPPTKDGTASKDGKATDSSAKKELPKKGPPPLPLKKDKSGTPKKDSGGPSNDPIPRRALIISVNNYLMLNPLLYGTDQGGKYPGSSPYVLRRRLEEVMKFSEKQITELSDSVPAEVRTAKAHSTQKSVIETTIKDFLEASREQDRLFILFAGHAVSVEDKSYLVPIEGNIKDVSSLVPLKWVFDQLAKCKSQQKILVLDVFRYSPSRGYKLPLPGEGDEGTMPEAFEKDLQKPPAGVQVWVSCKKEQCSVELDAGSAFLQALSKAMRERSGGFTMPTDPIPLDSLVTKVNDELKSILATEKRTQVSQVFGKAPEMTVAYDPKLPLPPALTLKPPTVAGAEAAKPELVNNILNEFAKKLPPVREADAGDVNLYQAQNLPAFSAKKLEAYQPDGYKNVGELFDKYKKTKEVFSSQYPLRSAFFEAVEVLEESNKIRMHEVLIGPINPMKKAAFLKEQADPGISIFKLEQVLAAVKAAGEERDKETSRRWQANFDYMQARLQSRLVYLFEYSYTLGQVRADNLPDLGEGQSGWRIGTNKKIKVTESKAKAYAKDTAKLWKRIQDEYPETPWALLSQRESMISLGLEWRAKSD